MTTYVIRGYHWGYNDEVFFPEGTFLHSQYNTEEAAKQAWKKLELSYWKDMNAYETFAFFDNDRDSIDKLKAFYTEKTGKVLDESRHEFYITREITKEDDALEFLKLADLQAFKITQFDEEPCFYALYFPEQEHYLVTYSEGPDMLVYAASVDELIKASADELEHHWDDDCHVMLNGDYADLSESPKLLEDAVSEFKLKFNADKKRLRLPTNNARALFAISDLLKKPLFEVRKLSFDEVKKIESQFESDYYEG